MSKRAWMPWYVGDYLADTAHLTQAQHGAYLLLIAAYWSRGISSTDGSTIGLPTVDFCVRIARAHTDDEVKNVCYVLAEFFDRQADGTFRHPRIDEELVEATRLIEQRKYVSRLGVEARQKKRGHNNLHQPEVQPEVELLVEPSVQPSTLTITNLDITKDSLFKEKEKIQKKKKKADGLDENFSRFWSAYPRRVGRGAALKAWEKVNPSDELTQLILDAVKAQSQSEQWSRDNGAFIPHPSTWLNQTRWLDDAPASSASAFEGVL